MENVWPRGEGTMAKWKWKEEARRNRGGGGGHNGQKAPGYRRGEEDICGQMYICEGNVKKWVINSPKLGNWIGWAPILIKLEQIIWCHRKEQKIGHKKFHSDWSIAGKVINLVQFWGKIHSSGHYILHNGPIQVDLGSFCSSFLE